MLQKLKPIVAAPIFYFHDLHPRPADMQKEVLEGLVKTPKKLSPKFFYDVAGSDLFNQITQLREYYLTRTERKILEDSLPELRELFGADCTIIEYGCGSSEKIKILLQTLPKALCYVAIDISQKHLLNLAESIASEFLSLEVLAVCADFTAHLDLPLDFERSGKRVVFFPGSSIGNFDPEEAKGFLHNISKTLGRGGGLLIGVDLKKDPKILHAAYNDTQGVTAGFNLNLLKRINRECVANFDLSQFRHKAFYHEAPGRIEMHLVSLQDQRVELKGVQIPFRKGESIHTENSYKYTVKEFQDLASQAGWKPIRVWTDNDKLFSVHYLENWR